MSQLRFLLMGIEQDPHLSDVRHALRDQGAIVEIVNSRTVGQEQLAFKSLNRNIDEWDAIWVRYLPPLYPKSEKQISISSIQKQRAIRSFVLQWLSEQKRSGTTVHPPLSEGTYDQFKITDLQVAQKSGLNTPRTACVMNLADAQDFIAQEKQNIIVKPVIGGQFAQHLTRIQLEHWFNTYGPLTLQQYVKGLSCRILFFKGLGVEAFVSSELNEVDWRAQAQSAHATIEWSPLKLPQALTETLAHFFEESQLSLASIDMILAEEQFYFLEANTTPSWLDLPQIHAQKITQKMADFLCQSVQG